MAHCEKIKARGGASDPLAGNRATGIPLRAGAGINIENPAASIRPSAIATFKARDRALSPEEIHGFFNALEQTATMATLRLAVKFLLLTLVRAMWAGNWARSHITRSLATLGRNSRGSRTGCWSPETPQ